MERIEEFNNKADELQTAILALRGTAVDEHHIRSLCDGLLRARCVVEQMHKDILMRRDEAIRLNSKVDTQDELIDKLISELKS